MSDQRMYTRRLTAGAVEIEKLPPDCAFYALGPIEYARCGHIVLVTFGGRDVYQRVGEAWRIL
jgi:hypothetical protein